MIKKILISGYYGFGNAGDELILGKLIDELNGLNPAIDITVMTNNSSNTAALHKTNVVHRWNFFAAALAIFRADMLIQGGGGLYQDRTSSFSLYYYLGIILLAKLFFKRIYIYSCGVNMLQKFNRKLLIGALKLCDCVTVRDSDSRELLIEWGFSGRTIHITGDPVLDSEYKQKALNTAKPVLAVTLRANHWLNTHAEQMSIIIDNIAKNMNAEILFIPFQGGDIAITKNISERMKSKFKIALWQNPREIFTLIRDSDFMISMRFHALIIAAQNGIPFVCISDDEKLERLTKSTGQRYFNLDDAPELHLLSDIAAESWQNVLILSQKLSHLVPDLIKSSARNKALLSKYILN